MRMIDVDALDEAMYHKSFETDDGRQKWYSGLWIRYKIYEEASREVPTVNAIPVQFIQDRIDSLQELAEYELESNGGYVGKVHTEVYALRALINYWKAERSAKGL